MADIEKTQGSKLQNLGQKLGEKCRLCIERVPFNYNRFKPRTVRFEGKQKCTVLFICG